MQTLFIPCLVDERQYLIFTQSGYFVHSTVHVEDEKIPQNNTSTPCLLSSFMMIWEVILAEVFSHVTY